MQRIPKITPSDYPDLLAAVDEGISEARIRHPNTSARDVSSLMNALSKLDAEGASAADDELRLQLVAARHRLRELERANARLPRNMGGVDEWLDALPPGVTWSHLPGAPVELVDTVGDAHLLMPEDVSFFVEHLGWTTPPVDEPEDELIEEWRAKIAEYDARRALERV